MTATTWRGLHAGPSPAVDAVVADRARRSLQMALTVGENPWGRLPEIAPTLAELGVDAAEPVWWDEVEDWDEYAPPRPALRTHEGVFDDLTDPYADFAPASLAASLVTPLPRRRRKAAPNPAPVEVESGKPVPYGMDEIRSWARSLGFEIGQGGRIPPEAWDAYHDMFGSQEAS